MSYVGRNIFLNKQILFEAGGLGTMNLACMPHSTLKGGQNYYDHFLANN